MKTICWHCQAETTAAHYDRIVHNKLRLHAEWDGWRLAGRFLVAPNNAGKITPARLLGMLWEERARSRRIASTTPNVTAVIPARELFTGQA